MLTFKRIEDDCLLKCTTDKPTYLQLCAQGVKIPIFCLGNQSVVDHSPIGYEEEQSILESILLAQWEDHLCKGHFRYDITTCELKVISGKRRFLAQLNEESMDYMLVFEDQNMLQGNLCLFNQTNQHEELFFSILSSDEAKSELISSDAVHCGSILVVINVNPVEYGHVFFVPGGFNSTEPVPNARFFEMVTRIAVEVNHYRFHLFYKCLGSNLSDSYFQGCYFPDCLPVECAPIETLLGDRKRGFHISSLEDYPIKTLLFESSSSSSQILVEVLSEIHSFLLDKNISFDLLISDCGKRAYLFLQRQMLSSSCSLSTWECGGYFVFRSRKEYDQVTEGEMLKRLSTASIDDESFAEVKELCCTIATKIMY